MNYHFTINFQGYDPLFVKLNQSDLANDYLYLLDRNLKQQPPLLRDQGGYSLQRMKELAQQCKEVLGWNWIHDDYNDFEITTKLHKDIERYLSKGFGKIPSEFDSLLHELHICLHSTQLQNQRTTIQIEWFNDDGFSLADYDFKFVHDGTLGSVFLQNPYVGHPPDWIWQQNDHTNVWQTCRFHDWVRPGLVINMQGNLEKTMIPFDYDRYLAWWYQNAPDFIKYHGESKMVANTGKPVIGYIVNNSILLDLAQETKIVLKSIEFNPDLTITPKRHFSPQMPISEQDYINIAGLDWPNYQDFCHDKNIPSWIADEIHAMTGIKIEP